MKPRSKVYLTSRCWINEWMKWWSSTSNNSINRHLTQKHLRELSPATGDTFHRIRGAAQLAAAAVDDGWTCLMACGSVPGDSEWCRVVKEPGPSSGVDPGRRNRKRICWGDTRQPTAASMVGLLHVQLPGSSMSPVRWGSASCCRRPHRWGPGPGSRRPPPGHTPRTLKNTTSLSRLVLNVTLMIYDILLMPI